MKQNITLAVEKKLLKQARAIAAERGLSVSACSPVNWRASWNRKENTGEHKRGLYHDWSRRSI